MGKYDWIDKKPYNPDFDRVFWDPIEIDPVVKPHEPKVPHEPYEPPMDLSVPEPPKPAFEGPTFKLPKLGEYIKPQEPRPMSFPQLKPSQPDTRLVHESRPTFSLKPGPLKPDYTPPLHFPPKLPDLPKYEGPNPPPLKPDWRRDWK